MAEIVTQSIDSSLGYLSINSQDVTAGVKKVTFPAKWIANDITAFGSSGRRYGAGIDESKFTVTFMFNQVATTGVHTVIGTAVFYAKISVAFIFCPAGNTSGQRKITGNCFCNEYQIESSVGDAVTVTATFLVDNGVTFGQVT